MRITCAATKPLLNLSNRNAYYLLLKKLSFLVFVGKAWQETKKLSHHSSSCATLPLPIQNIKNFFTQNWGFFISQQVRIRYPLLCVCTNALIVASICSSNSGQRSTTRKRTLISSSRTVFALSHQSASPSPQSPYAQGYIR
jgi:hypothetical protein